MLPLPVFSFHVRRKSEGKWDTEERKNKEKKKEKEEEYEKVEVARRRGVRADLHEVSRFYRPRWKIP